MDQRMSTKRMQDTPAEKRMLSAGDTTDSLVDLTDDERRVLDCLQAVDTGLTRSQLEARAMCRSSALDKALEDLLQRELIATLNTLVPSYTSRYPGIHI